jgi:putative phosphoesterase
VTLVGIISDTHGMMRPEALDALRDVAHILHAGDIGSEEVLAQLRKLAPVTAVRGNNDTQPWAKGIAEQEVFECEGRAIYMLHDLKELDRDPAMSGFAAVITGHSHKPLITNKDGLLFVNPGSAGPRRFKLPVTVGVLEVERDAIRASIRYLFHE